MLKNRKPNVHYAPMRYDNTLASTANGTSKLPQLNILWHCICADYAIHNMTFKHKTSF